MASSALLHLLVCGNVPMLNKEGRKLPVAIGGIIFFEGGFGVRDVVAEFSGRKGWAMDLDDGTFVQVDGINDLRAAARRAMAIPY